MVFPRLASGATTLNPDQSSALDKLRRRKRGEGKGGGDAGARDWCRETVFPELYFGGLVEALEEHMANGDLVFPEGK